MKKLSITDRIEKILRHTFILLTSFAIVYILVWEENPIGWEQIASAFITLILLILPTIFSRRTKIAIPPIIQISFLIFIFASTYLGEFRNFYLRYSWWDSMLHFFSALLLGYIGFLLIFALNKDREMHLRLSPFFIAVFTFSFAVMMGTMWEIFEYVMDHFVGLDMQKARYLGDDSRSGVIDTMKDLIIDSVGALFVSITGYIFCKKTKDDNLSFWKIRKQFIDSNPDLFEE